MRQAVKLLLVVLAILCAGIQFVRPARTNPPIDPALALDARHVPSDVAEILDRSCRDCHSNETRWPWYSNLAPASWLVIDHVNHGRSHFNYSGWERYTLEERASLVEGSCELARAGSMPMPSYLLMHRSARLAPSDVQALCAWAVPAPSH